MGTSLSQPIIPNESYPTSDKLTQYKIPKHVAYILDGNGRWAQAQNLSRSLGHIQGANNTVNVIKQTYAMDVQYITLYAFSTENWSRPQPEVDKIMALIYEFLVKFNDYLRRNQIALKVIGQSDKLPSYLHALLPTIGHPLDDSSPSQRVLCLALSYGGKSDVLEAAKAIIAAKLNADSLTDEVFRSYTALGKANLPDPDLVVRTSGEHRLSNFLLYNIAYAEFVVTTSLCKSSSSI